MSYESGNTNVLEMLDLAGIPIERVDRSDDDPIVLGGGSAVSNPEPMADFFDLIAVGEGEDLLQQVLNLHAEFDRTRPGWRDEFIAACARSIPGIYAPGLYEPQYAEDGAFLGHQRLLDDLPERIKRQYVDIDVYSGPRLPVVPNTGVVHDRIAVELDRGCARACRFCQAGYLYRPVRHRSKDLVKKAVDRCLTATGQSEVSLLSLNAVDYKGLDGVITDVYDSAEEYVRVSIPSTRVETFNVDVADALQRGGKRGGSLTFAPEAATSRMRRVINKEISDEDLLETCDMAFQRGFRTIKLYFMIGQPTETIEDARAIAHLANRVMAVGRRHHGNRPRSTSPSPPSSPSPSRRSNGTRRTAATPFAPSSRPASTSRATATFTSCGTTRRKATSKPCWRSATGASAAPSRALGNAAAASTAGASISSRRAGTRRSRPPASTSTGTSTASAIPTNPCPGTSSTSSSASAC